MAFHVIDYVVFAVTITLSIGIGLVVAFLGRNKTATNEDYLMGDRKMKLIPVAISLLVTYLSTIGILGNPAEVYAYGTQYMLYIIALIAGLLGGTFIFVPLFYPLRITSVFEYHHMRFGVRYVEIFALVLSIIAIVLFNAVLIYSPCMAFEAVSGFPSWASILISGFSAILYTTMGGMKAVVWTDCFQSLIIFAGLLTIVIKGTIEVGGFSEVWRLNEEYNKIKFLDFSVDPTERLTFWSVVVFNTFLWMAMTAAQPSVQRFMSLPSMKKAQMSSLFLIPGFIFSGLLTCFCGVTAFAYYAKKGCDPMMSGQIKGPNMILPYFAMDILTIPSLPGLFIACLFSASLSSVSSSYNSLGAILWPAFIQKRYGHLPPEKQTRITKLITLVFGIICIGTAFLVMQHGGTLIQVAYSVIGGIGGPLVGLGLVAGTFPNAGPRGIITGSSLAVAFCIWLSLGASFSGVYAPPIPGPTHNCTFPPGALGMGNNVNWTSDNYSDNGTSSWASHNVTLVPDTGQGPKNVAPPAGSVSMGHGKTGLNWMYSISYFYYPIIGIISVCVVSLIFSLIPKLELKQQRKTPKRLLFPCVRPCCGAKDDQDDSLDEKLDGTETHPLAPYEKDGTSKSRPGRGLSTEDLAGARFPHQDTDDEAQPPDYEDLVNSYSPADPWVHMGSGQTSSPSANNSNPASTVWTKQPTAPTLEGSITDPERQQFLYSL